MSRVVNSNLVHPALDRDTFRETFNRCVSDGQGVEYQQHLFTIYDRNWSPLKRWAIGWLAALLSALSTTDVSAP